MTATARVGGWCLSPLCTHGHAHVNARSRWWNMWACANQPRRWWHDSRTAVGGPRVPPSAAPARRRPSGTHAQHIHAPRGTQTTNMPTEKSEGRVLNATPNRQSNDRVNSATGSATCNKLVIGHVSEPDLRGPQQPAPRALALVIAPLSAAHPSFPPAPRESGLRPPRAPCLSPES